MQFLKFQNFCEIKKFVTLPMSRSIYEIDYLAFSNRILSLDFSLVKTDGPWEIFHLYILLYNAAIFIRLVINNSCLWKIRENENSSIISFNWHLPRKIMHEFGRTVPLHFWLYKLVHGLHYSMWWRSSLRFQLQSWSCILFWPMSM